ncbi:MAG TPA: [FeFe] hydrogenase H-cluster maturation GTPase HydF [Bacteroidales bacterium]|nr:MAG: [FeFe] hydrogenase H-cluster maturation GTPase HydF [Bacteroidetes bacterium GWE2_42_24]OFY31525.1 MAG: [FeFe] hydrogenase H-cluster maturation GTPase HydF [Bacteroidetes bacterium GWF2_43_11]HAQ65763.1 [FeFe] hydrogenase H-cluster maturation GTPase HydF [Bacteroidales bacterium]HBZ67225.1 [FeFe] hydrogenase H-cluster maturation GTPase HydF [Bacteroidales bacterium]
MIKGKESRPHIGIFGRRNQGKSSIINALASQEIAIVSDQAGTTTDPVKKTIEIHGIGPVVLIDTAGADDTGELGIKRVSRTLDVISQCDLALLVISHNQFGGKEIELLDHFNNDSVPYLIIHNKNDLEVLTDATQKLILACNPKTSIIDFSALRHEGVEELIRALQHAIPETAYRSTSMVGDLIKYGDTVLLITPIDIEAPEGRLILPQVQAIRDILDNDGIAVVCKEKETDSFIRRMNPKPALAITDSQIFLKTDAMIPPHIPLTSFSILLARQKGDFTNYLQGTPHIDKLLDNDCILILESCTHHVSCDDIGRMKIPRWLSTFSGKKLSYDVVSGLDRLPRPITEYALVIQCGGCVLTRRQIIGRLKPAVDAGIPVTNYGMAIAWIQGIYNRAVAPFLKEIADPTDYL